MASRKILVALIIALLVATAFVVVAGNSVAESPRTKKSSPGGIIYSMRTIDYRDVMRMMKKLGVRDPNKNYNVIIDGHGTGLAPPTLEDYVEMIGNVEYVESVKNYKPRASNDLSQSPYFPPVGNQGQQGSCAAWTTSYYSNTFLQAQLHDWREVHNGNTHHLMSPAWSYNKVNGGEDRGSFFDDNYNVIKTLGEPSLATMPYSDQDLISWGDEDAWREAPIGRIDGYQTTSVKNIDVIKSWIDSGSLVVFAINANAYNDGFSDGNYIISWSEYYYYAGSPNHAQTIVGYDDSVYDDGDRGAFLVVNSWGTNWGDYGFYWLTYNAFTHLYSDLAYRPVASKPNNPHLLAVWRFSNAPTRQDTVTIGLQNSCSREAYWEGSNYRLPSFMAMDLSEFEDDWNNGYSNFYLKIGGSSSGTVSSFKIEYYANGYDPGNPTDVSSESPDVPAYVPGTVTNTYSGGPGPTPQHPYVVSTYPENGATNVPTTLSEIRIKFSEKMDVNSVKNALSITPSVDYTVTTGADSSEIILQLGGGGNEYTEGNSEEGSLLASVYYAYTTAQTFQLSKDGYVTSVDIYMLKVGSPPYDCTLEIRELDSSGYPTGSVLGTASVSPSAVSTSLSWVTFTFGSPVYLRSGVSYGLVLSMNGGDSNNRYRWGVVNGDVYSNGILEQKQSGTWYSFSGYDGSFLIHYTTNREVREEKVIGNSQEGTVGGSVYVDYTTAQTFKMPEDGDVTYVQIYMWKVGSPPYDCTLEIRELDSSGYPTGTVYGSTSVSPSQVSTSASWVTFTFSSPVHLSAGSYGLVLSMNGGDNYNKYRWAAVAQNVYPDGVIEQKQYGTWYSFSGYDASFLVHYQTSGGGGGNLQPNTKYTVTIRKTAKDINGNYMENDYSFSFTTGSKVLDIEVPVPYAPVISICPVTMELFASYLAVCPVSKEFFSI